MDDELETILRKQITHLQELVISQTSQTAFWYEQAIRLDPSLMEKRHTQDIPMLAVFRNMHVLVPQTFFEEGR